VIGGPLVAHRRCRVAEGAQARNGSVIVSSLINAESLSGNWDGAICPRKCCALCGPPLEPLVYLTHACVQMEAEEA
jgi:hypothetical protein